MNRYDNGKPMWPEGGKLVACEDFPDGAIGLLAFLWQSDTSTVEVALLESGNHDKMEISYTYKSGPKAGKGFKANYWVGAYVRTYPVEMLDVVLEYVREDNKWSMEQRGQKAA